MISIEKLLIPRPSGLLSGKDLEGCVFYAPLWHGKLQGSPFPSLDQYHHLCTVTGAVWGTTGRFFDGATGRDDIITVTAAASIQDIFDGGGTLIVWIKAASVGENGIGRMMETGGGAAVGWAFYLFGEAAGLFKVAFSQYFDVLLGTWQHATTIVPINSWTQVALTYNGSSSANDPILYLNGAVSGGGWYESSVPNGTLVSDIGKTPKIGNNTATTTTFDGYIGEVTGYKGRMLSLAEIQNNYLATKWRYS